MSLSLCHYVKVLFFFPGHSYSQEKKKEKSNRRQCNTFDTVAAAADMRKPSKICTRAKVASTTPGRSQAREPGRRWGPTIGMNGDVRA
jgi:hypothetical protein